jgi:hypothetical protein
MTMPIVRDDAASQDHAQHCAGFGAERHANPDLLPALADRVRQDAVDSNLAESRRDGGEHPEHIGVVEDLRQSRLDAAPTPQMFMD